MGLDSPHDLRASDADREATVGRLRVAAMEGRLDAEELAQRVTAAYEAKWCRDLDRLTLDVTPVAPPARHHGSPVFLRPAQQTNALAIASLIFGLVWAAWLGSIAAVLLGHAALRQIRMSGGRQTGRGLAVAGLMLGYFGLFTLSLTILRVLIPG